MTHNDLTKHYYVPAPALASLSATSGPAVGGNVVTLTGTNFTGANMVRFQLNGRALTFTTQVAFGGTPAPFTVLCDNQVIATAPPGSTGTVLVRVTTPGRTSAGVGYTYVASPGSLLPENVTIARPSARTGILCDTGE